MLKQIFSDHMTTGDTQFDLTGTDSPRNVENELSQTLAGFASVQESASSGANQGMASKGEMSSSSSRLTEGESVSDLIDYFNQEYQEINSDQMRANKE